MTVTTTHCYFRECPFEAQVEISLLGKHPSGDTSAHPFCLFHAAGMIQIMRSNRGEIARLTKDEIERLVKA